MKVSKKDVLLLLAFLGILAGVCSFVFVFQPTMEKADALKQENLQLESRIADLQAKSDNRDTYESETAKMRREMEEIYQLFPVDVREENAILLAINQELLAPMEVESITIDALLEVPFLDEAQQQDMPDATYEIEEVEEIEDATGTQEAPTPEAGDTTGAAGVNPFHLMSRKATINYEISYEGLKRSVKNICMQTDRTVIDNLSVVYDEQTGLLKGVTTVNLYCVPDQEDKEYVEPDFGGVLLGTNNIFGTRVIRSEAGLPDLEDGEEGEAEENAEE
ncbi:MAG: hypothetical protein NC302_08275 [Bacteroidales bacterium]|nr:hypothetical protein [Bacteroidales bacterium]MCM1415123.1 hypothetical protein [bacterium]MCM1423041.1 hypothetical protein [bacterium]